MPGKPEAENIGQLYDRLGPSLFRYALMILGNPAAAEDVVHDVFTAIVRRPPSGIDRIDHYLRVAIRNGCYTRLRQRTPELVSLKPEHVLFDPSAGPDRRDERLLLDRALRSLPPDQREVIHLKIYEGLTFQEIADLSGESINTIASRYRYAMEKLRAVIAPAQR